MPSPRPTVAAIATVLLASALGCQSPPPVIGSAGGRADPTRDTPSEIDVQAPRSADLVEATDRMAADLASRIDIVDREDPPMIVLGNVVNRATRMAPGDLDVFLVRLRAQLNRSITREGLRFVRERTYVEDARRREFGGEPGSSAGDYRSSADYELTAEIFDMPRGGTNYYLISYQLVLLRPSTSAPDIASGTIVWENMYEVKFQ